VPAHPVGAVTGPSGAVRIAAGSGRVDLPSAALRRTYESAIPRRLDGAGGTLLAREV
jgi:hypothetical protein